MNYADIAFWSLLVFYWQIFAWDLYVRYRQYNIIKNCENRPDSVAEIISEDDYRDARLRKLDIYRLAVIQKLYFALLTLGMMLSHQFLSDTVWHYVSDWAGQSMMLHGAYFMHTFFAIFFASYIALHLPVALHNTMAGGNIFEEAIDESFGIEMIFLAFCYAAFAVTPGGSILLKMFMGERLFFICWLSIGGSILVATACYPMLISLLSGDIKPLPECSLKRKITALAKKAGFPLNQICVVEDSSWKSRDKGICEIEWWNSTRIFLSDRFLSDELNEKDEDADRNSICSTVPSMASEDYDNEDLDKTNYSLHTCEENSDNEASVHTCNSLTSCEGEYIVAGEKSDNLEFSNGEILALISRELGRWELHHDVFNFVFYQAKVLHWLLVISAVLAPEESFFGTGRLSIYLFAQIFFTVSSAIECHANRQMEFAADRYSVKLGQGKKLRSALIKIEKRQFCEGVNDLPLDDHIYSSIKNSVPTTVERLQALKKCE